MRSVEQGTEARLFQPIALGTLFREPTRLNVVAVVVDKNHKEQKLMMKPQNAERQAAAWKPRMYIAGSAATLLNSPFTAATRQSNGSDSALL